jgi:hypothetical protein
MTPEMIRRDAHRPHARSGGSTALSCRRVTLLIAAAPRLLIEPRTGKLSATPEVHQRMMTFVNVNICHCQRGGSPRQLKLLTYLPMSRASCRFAPDGLPSPKSGPNWRNGPTAAAMRARSFLIATIAITRIRM